MKKITCFDIAGGGRRERDDAFVRIINSEE